MTDQSSHAKPQVTENTSLFPWPYLSLLVRYIISMVEVTAIMSAAVISTTEIKQCSAQNDIANFHHDRQITNAYS